MQIRIPVSCRAFAAKWAAKPAAATLAALLAPAALHTAAAQTIDITAAKADPITRIFDDNRNTVMSYVYSVLESKSDCSGNDAIYMEVTIRPDGTTESAKALTGRNDCIKRTIVDILSDIRWDATNIKTNKKIYFELKPALPGGPNKRNEYQPMTLAAQQERTRGGNTQPLASANPPAQQPAQQSTQQPAAQPEAQSQQPPAQPAQPAQPAAEPAAKPATQPAQPAQPARQPEPAPQTQEDARRNAWKDEGPAPAKAQPQPASATPAPKATTGTAKLPTPRYVSAGDRAPDASHRETHANAPGPALGTPEYVDGEAMKAIFIKQELRKTGVCGLAHVLAELTVEKDGSVSGYRLFQSNNTQVRNAIGPVLTRLKFKPETVPFRQNIYLEVKADVECTGQQAPKANLDDVPDYLKQGDAR